MQIIKSYKKKKKIEERVCLKASVLWSINHNLLHFFFILYKITMV